ncbi:rod shape-determining protein MreD [Deinococcus peraridilitoris]|uniref:Rod shape-determining protein MreD n=1 Tax=Deinococcus peraridilitoris (strain DSM 19664 / LMG 22246 / CIP 109416 / KR-200) TaxID=937777 RepID=K9ZYN0_DEIPD|nr:rod shape-determining protein MreD [Deinococcus peraridilitoris]AFZ65865.1 rod shape-determining protein MreD [Deinococcus peraridilitoris DSM 19664]
MRILIYLLLIIGIQGALTRLIPRELSAPDLFLLTAIALALRLRPLPALLLAYGIGLLQDILGHGALGLHAAAVSGGVLLVLGLRKFLSDRGFIQTVVTVTTGVIGQWLVFLILTYWLRNGLVTINTLVTVLPSLLIGTLLAAPLLERLAAWAFGTRPGAEQGLT